MCALRYTFDGEETELRRDLGKDMGMGRIRVDLGVIRCSRIMRMSLEGLCARHSHPAMA